MQGVGPAQLTWYEYQDAADLKGGCWKPKYNIRVAMQVLGSHYRTQGSIGKAFQKYNGSGPAAYAYARDAVERQKKWHKRLT